MKSAHIKVEQLATSLSPHDEEHLASCNECRQWVAAARSVDNAPLVVPTALCARVLASARAELQATPRARPWWINAALLVLTSVGIAVVAGALMARALPGEGTRLAVLVALLGVQVVAGISAIAPRRRAWRLASVLLALGAAVAMIIDADGTPPASPGLACAVMEVGLAIVPLVLGFLLLRRVAPLPSRFLSLGLATGAVGALVLDIHCAPSPLHVAIFHVLPWGLVALFTLLAGRLLPRRAYVP